MESVDNMQERKLEELSLEANVACPVDPFEKMRKAFEEFKAYFKKEKELFDALAQSQHPKWMIIACSDSRVDPALVLGLELGEAFILRNIASLIPPHSKQSGHKSGASAIEYAVEHLKVKHIMIVGHSRCGGIKALLEMKEDGSNRFSEYIEDWIQIAQPASEIAKAKVPHDSPLEELWTCCVKESVNLSLRNCMSYPFVKIPMEKGLLTLHGAFDVWKLKCKIDEHQSL
ncbi:hypothetical protein KP509_1Z242300 [Ceratopteris richardii]|nr:hypothetical protein KP509_1Z242300 [Ceratopteris richardii]